MATLIDHLHFRNARMHVLKAMNSMGGNALIRILGVTGAGKSEACMAAAREFAGPADRWGDGRLPVVWVRATKCDRGRFSSKAFALRCFMAVQAPTLTWLGSAGKAGQPDALEYVQSNALDLPFWKGMRSAGSEEVLRIAFADQARARGVKLLIIDDAHAMCSSRRSEAPSDLLQPWLSMARELSFKIVLCGTSAMRTLSDGEGEVSREAHRIYVNRYRQGIDDDKREFSGIVVKLAKEFGFENLVVERHAGFLYDATAGVFGEARALFIRASSIAEADGRSGLQWRDLKQAGPNHSELTELIARVHEFDGLANPLEAKDMRNAWTNAEAARDLGRVGRGEGS